jgi:SAM-dependent methyltransferase
VDASGWDERYRSADLIWGVAPNRWVAQEVADLPAGRALDLACGEGRNALWLAGRGWRVTAVDFSPVGLEKARQLQHGTGAVVDWVCADVLTYRCPDRVDLALLCYLQLPSAQRRVVVRQTAASLAPGGVLLVIGHDSANLQDGYGGPQDPTVLFTALDVAADLDGTGLVVERADTVRRPVEGAPRPALDALLRARRNGPATRSAT